MDTVDSVVSINISKMANANASQLSILLMANVEHALRDKFMTHISCAAMNSVILDKNMKMESVYASKDTTL